MRPDEHAPDTVRVDLATRSSRRSPTAGAAPVAALGDRPAPAFATDLRDAGCSPRYPAGAYVPAGDGPSDARSPAPDSSRASTARSGPSWPPLPLADHRRRRRRSCSSWPPSLRPSSTRPPRVAVDAVGATMA